VAARSSSGGTGFSGRTGRRNLETAAP
jgi:hypothetical protein